MTRRSKSKSSAFKDTLENLTVWFKESERLNRYLNGVLAALVVMVSLGAVVVGLKYLESYVNRLPVFTSSEVKACLETRPEWMSEDLAREILIDSFKPIHEVLVQMHRDGRDADMPQVLATQLSKNAWVNKVMWVRRGYGGRMVINCTFREPTALVNMTEWCYLIDGDGFPLPGKYKYTALSGCGMMEINGCSGSAPPAGQKWTAEDLQAGLRLAKVLATVPFRSQIKAIDVSNFKGRRDNAACWITLLTDRDTQIKWGKPVGEERGLENTTAQKVALLAGVYCTHGHISMGRAYVDVRRSPTQVDLSVAAASQPEP